MDSIKFQFISLCKGCHQLPKMGRTLSANLVYQSDYEIGSTIPSGEANKDHDMMMVIPW